MASAKAIICVIIASMMGYVTSQKHVSATFDYRGICPSINCSSIQSLMTLRNCTVVLGALTISHMENTRQEDFANISFPELREVTGYMIIYRIFGLESIGDLFPNLTRIRGANLVSNYALIIYDLPHLVDVGMYGLLKVDRGGIIIYGADMTCYVDTINWELITNGRHVVYPTDTYPQCTNICRCSLNPTTNYCWNNMKCQRFLEGPEAEKCDEQCFGCRNTNASKCSLCRYYTHRGECVSKCPNGTIVISVNNYCVTEGECKKLGGWSWNNFCMFECPQNYIKRDTTTGSTCKRCDTCKKTCKSIYIQTLANIQSAQNCVYINGSLTIRIRSILPEALEEMRHYLSVIQEVSDYIFIHSSISITSLDFLASLQRIKGHNLLNGRYSLVVSGMLNLQTLFTPSVTKNLIVDNGTLSFHDNPMLCVSQIHELKMKFPKAPSEIDVPQGLNGYSGGCNELSLQLRVEVKNETFAVAIFNRVMNENIHYSILYVRIPSGKHSTLVPEACSESEWDAINIPSSKLNSNTVFMEISSLRPASSYALCIETYDPVSLQLARSSIVNFNTTVGKPEPPFITELVASSSDTVVIRWVDHKDYRSHIDHYELDVSVIEIASKDIAARDHCIPVVEYRKDFDYSRHAVVMRPPKHYEKGCESMCGVLSTVTVGAMTEDYFDICSSLRSDCDEYENPVRLTNSTFGKYIKTLVLNISIPRSDFEINNLAPFRDYRFKLRACTNNKCSRFSRSSVRTLRLNGADVPHIDLVIVREPGNIDIKWKPPKVTNGPILAYHIEILPILPDVENLMPQIRCVPGNITNFIVKFDVAKKYIVRVCSTTFGSNYVCSNRRSVTVPWESKWWWMGFPFAITLYLSSFIIGWIVKIKKRMSDEIRLVDITSSYRNMSEPPSKMLSDPASLYTVPLRESNLISLE